MIPDVAVKAAAKIYYRPTGDMAIDVDEWMTCCRDARLALEAAAQHLLSHEREETRLAHLDAVVNAASLSKYEEAIQHLRDLADNAERDRDYVKVVDAAAIHAAIDDTLGE